MSDEHGGKQAVAISLVALFICLFSFFNSCDAKINTEKALGTPAPLATREAERVNVVNADGTPVWTCDEVDVRNGYSLVGCVPFSVPGATEVKR